MLDVTTTGAATRSPAQDPQPCRTRVAQIVAQGDAVREFHSISYAGSDRTLRLRAGRFLDEPNTPEQRFRELLAVLVARAREMLPTAREHYERARWLLGCDCQAGPDAGGEAHD